MEAIILDQDFIEINLVDIGTEIFTCDPIYIEYNNNVSLINDWLKATLDNAPNSILVDRRLKEIEARLADLDPENSGTVLLLSLDGYDLVTSDGFTLKSL